MFDGFKDEARRVVVVARKGARDLHHPFVGTEHLLLALLSEDDAIAKEVLAKLGVPLETVRNEVAERVGHWDGATKDSPPFTPRAKKVLKTATTVGHGSTGTEHIWVGLDLEREGVAAEVLADLGVSLDSVRAIIMRAIRQNRATGWVGTALVTGRLTRFQRFWYRYPGRLMFPLVAWLDCSVPGTKGRLGWLYRPAPRPGESVTGSTVITRQHRAVRDVFEGQLPVGTEWTASTVVAGRGPEDFAKGYEEMRRLAAKVGLDVDDARVRVTSVQTDEGPGLRLLLAHRLDEHDGGENDEGE
jgi:hypothetical protein